MRPIDVFFKISAIDFFCFQWPIIKNIEYLEFLRLIWVFAKLGNITTFLNLQCCTTMQNYKKIIRLDSINDHLHKVLNPIWVRMTFLNYSYWCSCLYGLLLGCFLVCFLLCYLVCLCVYLNFSLFLLVEGGRGYYLVLCWFLLFFSKEKD